MPTNNSSSGRPRRSSRRLSVRAVLRTSPDLDTIASTVAALAIAQAEKEAQEAARASEDRS